MRHQPGLEVFATSGCNAWRLGAQLLFQQKTRRAQGRAHPLIGGLVRTG